MIADQAARRGGEGQPGLAAAGRAHVGHLALALRHLLDDRARMLVVDVDDDRLIGLLAAVRAVAEEHARAADRQLEALAAHRLDQHAELQLAAAGDLERVLLGALGQADRDIALGLALQPVADHAALHLVAVAAGIGAVVDREAHRQRRRIDRAGARAAGSRRDRRWCWRRSPWSGRRWRRCRPPWRCSTGTRSRPRKAKTLVARPSSTALAVDVERLDRHVDVERAALDPAGQDAAEERVAVEQGREHLERAVGDRASGAGTWLTIVSNSGVRSPERTSSVRPGIAGAARGVEGREIELLVIGLERQEQLEHLVEHFGGAGVGAVDLVDDDDRPAGRARAPCR